MVQGEPRTRLGHHGGWVRWRHRALHPGDFVAHCDARLSGDVRRDRHLPGTRHPDGRPVPETSSCAACGAGAGRRGGTSQIGKRQFTTFEMLSTPQFYWMYVGVRADGDRRPAGHGERRAYRHGRGDFRPACSRLRRRSVRWPTAAAAVFWGWASDRLGRETTMVLTFVLQAVCLASVVTLGQLSGRLVRRHARRGVFHLGPDLFALPVDVRRLLRHATRDIELRRDLHREGRGVDHRALGRRADLRADGQLGDGLSTAAQ